MNFVCKNAETQHKICTTSNNQCISFMHFKQSGSFQNLVKGFLFSFVFKGKSYIFQASEKPKKKKNKKGPFDSNKEKPKYTNRILE